MRADTGIRVVIDTNVWISGLLTKTGAPALVTRWVMAECQPVFTMQTFAELELRLWRPKFDRYVSMDDRKAFLHDLSGLARWVEVPESIATQVFSRDADDDKFIHAALAAKALWLITGDRDLLDLSALQDLRILTSVDALQLTRGQN